MSRIVDDEILLDYELEEKIKKIKTKIKILWGALIVSIVAALAIVILTIMTAGGVSMYIILQRAPLVTVIVSGLGVVIILSAINIVVSSEELKKFKKNKK